MWSVFSWWHIWTSVCKTLGSIPALKRKSNSYLYFPCQYVLNNLQASFSFDLARNVIGRGFSSHLRLFTNLFKPILSFSLHYTMLYSVLWKTVCLDMPFFVDKGTANFWSASWWSWRKLVLFLVLDTRCSKHIVEGFVETVVKARDPSYLWVILSALWRIL